MKAASPAKTAEANKPREDIRKVVLGEDIIPDKWYNIVADFPVKPSPPLHPGTQKPMNPADLAPLFAPALIEQELSQERYIDIPKEVRDVYKIWRPTPLFRARGLEKLLGTPARIYYKAEFVSPVGSHKINTSVPQAYYNKIAGVNRITTETGAGQWGLALSLAGSMYDQKIEVFMVKSSAAQKPYRKALMEVYGAKCTPSPSMDTEFGRKTLAETPDHPGSLGVAISEAVELAVKDPGCHYALGSVLNHVLLHQSIIGDEAIRQFKEFNDYPDIVVGCAGGGSNLAGICFPFLGRALRGEAPKTLRCVAVEPESCPTLTKGTFAFDHGDAAGLTPLLKMYTLGSHFVPATSHAGGLRYHGMAPLVSHAMHLKLIEAVAVPQTAALEAGVMFAKCEGVVPAPESSHAIKGAIDEALKCKKDGVSKAILFNLTGHGFLDMPAYQAFLENNLVDASFNCEGLKKALDKLPKLDSEYMSY